MISEKHDTNILTYWFREWLRSGAATPKEVVTDYSFALINAVTLAFNNCDLNTYVERCMNMLYDNDVTSIPNCVLRIDIAHLIKAVCGWKCFKDKHVRIKDFFVRCIGILSQAITIDTFSQICTDTLTVAFSETEELGNDTLGGSFHAQQRLVNLIRTYDLQNYENSTAEEYLTEDIDNESFECRKSSRINDFLTNIERNSKKFVNSGDRPNPYYCPNFGISLLRLCKQFPLWTAVMAFNGINVASSARSEQYFNELKNLVFGGTKNIRADKFLIRHIQSLAGAAKLLNTCINVSNEEQEIAKVSQFSVTESHDSKTSNETKIANISKCLDNDIEHNDADILCNSSIEETHDKKSPTPSTVLNEVETWKSHKDKNLKRGKYVTVCPDIISIHKKPQASSKISLLSNGNNLRPQQIAGQHIMVNNTCAFDAVIQALLVGYRDWTNYYNFINSSTNEILNFITTVSTYGTQQKVYKERALILSKIFQPTSGAINCACNINNLINNNLMKNVISYSIIKRCSICEWQHQQDTIVTEINTQPIYEYGMRGLQEALDQKITTIYKKCSRCTNDNVDFTFIAGAHLFIDIECLLWVELANRLGHSDWSGMITLSEIPLDIQLYENTYALVAAIEYVGGTNNNEIGHYIAYCHRITGKWQIYDDLNKNKFPITASARVLLQKKKICLLIFIKK